jgi:hypothetical protein
MLPKDAREPEAHRQRRWKSILTGFVVFSVGIAIGWYGRDGFDAWIGPWVTGLPSDLARSELSIYTNARFEYRLSYPSRLLFPQGEADNGDGQTFLSRDAKARLSVYGTHNALDETLESAFQEASRGGLPDAPNRVVSDKRLGDNWFIVSGYQEGSIFYLKRYLIDDRFVSFDIIYPESQRSTWDRVVAKINDGFVPPMPES